ncbi:hypothetical protein IFR05_013799 [Cadophora sp. M221]|nr:hypothetical protein IFR05_013799 [Cadophora sp. M221]
MMSDYSNYNPPGYTQSDRHPSGLVRAALETGRIRGSSATPVPALEVVSPSPQRPLLPYIASMDNAIRSFNGSTGAPSDHNSRQVSPAASVRSEHTTKAKAILITLLAHLFAVLVRIQVRLTAVHLKVITKINFIPKTPLASRFAALIKILVKLKAVHLKARTLANVNLRTLLAPLFVVPVKTLAKLKAVHLKVHLKVSPRTLHTRQSVTQRQTPPQGNNYDRPANQFQGHIYSQAQGPPQFQNSIIPAWQIAGAALYQSTAQNQQSQGPNQSPQGRNQSQNQSQSPGQTQIHPQGQSQGQHRRQISSSRMNPAVPPFQSNFQSNFTSNFQTFQPLQPMIFTSQMPQQVHNMMADTQEVHAKANEMIQKIKDVDAMSSALQERLIENTEEIRRSYDRSSHRMKTEFEKLFVQYQTSQMLLENTTENLRQAYQERDSMGHANGDLLRAKEREEQKAKESNRKLEKLEQEWKKLDAESKQKLADKDAEIERHCRLIRELNLELDHHHARDVKFLDAAHVRWLAENPPSSVRSRRSTRTTQDSFESPSVASSATFAVSGMSALSLGSPPSKLNDGMTGHSYSQSTAFGHVRPNGGPPNATAEQMFPEPSQQTRRFPNLPTQRAVRGRADIPTSPWETESSRAYNTEPGDTPMAGSRALVLSSGSGQDPSIFYQDHFAELYQLIEGWAMAYCTKPKISNDQAIARTNQSLWAFMMDCTYPGQRQDAHSHLMLLLNDAKSRPWFVVRMGVAYVVAEMLSLKSYKNFSPQIAAELLAVKNQLKERGLANDARQALTDRRANAIQSAVSSPYWEKYRGEQLFEHSKQLRGILGPMLNDSADRSTAGKDLGVIALKAWEISEHMNTAQVTFQVYFPETAGKFNAATMISRDNTITSPMNLQISQTRVKLVITPVITMRDDRGTTIKAKNLHFSTVLTMA